MLVRALAHTLAYGRGLPTGNRRRGAQCELYVRQQLEGVFELSYSLPFMHEVAFRPKNGVNTMQIAKRVIEYGFDPYMTAFPMNVPDALMIEPMKSESKKECAAHNASQPPRQSRRGSQAGPMEAHLTSGPGLGHCCPACHRTGSETSNSLNGITEIFGHSSDLILHTNAIFSLATSAARNPVESTSVYDPSDFPRQPRSGLLHLYVNKR